MSVHAHVCDLLTESGSRAGGTRTPNRRFWRPVLCQIELLPSADGLRVGSFGGEDSTSRPDSAGGRAHRAPGTAGGRDASPVGQSPAGNPGRGLSAEPEARPDRGRSARELALRQSRAVGDLTCARQQCDLVGQNHKGSTVTLEGKRPERTVAARPDRAAPARERWQLRGRPRPPPKLARPGVAPPTRSSTGTARGRDHRHQGRLAWRPRQSGQIGRTAQPDRSSRGNTPPHSWPPGCEEPLTGTLRRPAGSAGSADASDADRPSDSCSRGSGEGVGIVNGRLLRPDEAPIKAVHHPCHICFRLSTI